MSEESKKTGLTQEQIKSMLPTARIRAWNKDFYKADDKEKIEILFDELTRAQLDIMSLQAAVGMLRETARHLPNF